MAETALARLGEETASLLFQKIVRSETHMEIPEGIDFESWFNLTALVGEFHLHSRWWLADLLAFGERKFGESYASIGDRFNLEPQTLANMVSVAHSVPPNRRVQTLSFEHHAEVAVLEPRQQSQLLAKAAKEDWDRAQIRDAKRELKADPSKKASEIDPPPRGTCEQCGAPTIEVLNPDGERIIKYARP